MSIPNTPQNDAAHTPAQPQEAAPIIVDAPVTAPPAPADAPAGAPAAAAPSYAATAPAAASAPETSDSNTLSITSFVLGLCSIVLGWTFVAPIVGLVIGIMARKREPRGRAFANWGIGLNAAMLVLSALMIILFFVFAAFFLPFLITAADNPSFYVN